MIDETYKQFAENERHHEILDAVIRCGSNNKAAAELGCSRRNVDKIIVGIKSRRREFIKANTAPTTTGRVHIFLPDKQVKENVPLEHLDWIGWYIGRKRPDVIIDAGDFADMPSLSSYDRGKIGFEGRRYHKDIEVSNSAFDRLNKPIEAARQEYNQANPYAPWNPEKHFLLGNHENRINRAVESQSELQGSLSTDDLNYADHGYKVHDFLTPVDIDGILYSHYFCRSPNGQVMQSKRGAPNARLQVIREMQSCTAGHLQGMQWHPQPYAGGIRYGLIAGSCYLHDEEYLTAQGTNYWRGIIVKRGVKDGEYAPWFVTLDWLCRECEGVSLKKFMAKRYKVAA